MSFRPETGTNTSDKVRGIGELGKTTDYLKLDPITYYYNLFKSESNQYLNTEMWSEAARRGESSALVSYLNTIRNNEKNGITDESFNAALQTYNKNTNRGLTDYDEYMLTMSLPSLDDTTTTTRTDDETGYVFGDYTDRGWAEAVLTSLAQRHEAEYVEQKKESMEWYQKAGAWIGSTTSTLVSGIMKGVNALYNIGEGIVNIFANWGDDDSLGDRFLYAFSNDDENDPLLLNQSAEYFEELAYRLDYEYTDTVNAIEAYEAGYIPNSWHDMFFGNWRNGVGVGAGYNTAQSIWKSIVDSIGYMLPSFIITQGLGVAGVSSNVAGKVGQTVFYAQVFSDNIKDTVEYAQNNNMSYKDLNSGEVISNALVKAGAQWAVEFALGKILDSLGTLSSRMKGFGKGTTRSISKIGSNGAQALAIFGKRALQNMAKEGLEEVLQDMSDGIVDYFYSRAGSDLSEYYKQSSVEKFSINNLLQSFIAGALTEGLLGTINTLQYIPGRHRLYSTNTDNQIYKLGVFQSMNMAEALSTLNNWNDILNDNKVKGSVKQDTALKMSMGLSVIGDTVKSFGLKEAANLNAALTAYANDETMLNKIKNMSDVEYAQYLYKDFTTKYDNLVKEQRIKELDNSILKKIKNGISKFTGLFKKTRVTEIENVVSQKMTAKDIAETMNLEVKDAQQFVNKLKALGADVIVTTDGNVVAKSENVIFAGDDIISNAIKTGDLSQILQGVAYQSARDNVKTALNASQTKMILQAYKKVTGIDATLDEAIDALLFDRSFYTYVFLLSGERNYQSQALELLASVDQLMDEKLVPATEAGTLTQAAYNTLMKKVRKNMESGIIAYATHYARLDLDKVSDKVLSTEIKELIRNNKNVLFSNELDNATNNRKHEALNSEQITRLDNYIDKFNEYLDADTIKSIKEAIRSNDPNTRLDGIIPIIEATRRSGVDSKNKLVYLPTSPDLILERDYISKVEDYFGVKWTELINGNFEAYNLPVETQAFLMNRYDLSSDISRMAAIDEVLYMISHGTLSLGKDSTILRVMDKQSFLKDEYLGENGTKNFRRDLREGKIKTIADVTKVTIPKELANISIERGMLGTTKSIYGRYVDGDKIYLQGSATTDNLMHEITHATQDVTSIGQDQIVHGGETETFNLLPDNVKKDLTTYMEENFPITWNYFNQKGINMPQVAYFMLEGELKANSTLNTYIFDSGFTYKDNRTKLVTPDNKAVFDLTPAKSKVIQESKKQFKEQVAQKTTKITDTKENNVENKKTTNKTKTVEGQMSLFDTDQKSSQDVDLVDNDTKKIETLSQEIDTKTYNKVVQNINNTTLYKGSSTAGIEAFDNAQGGKLRTVANAAYLTTSKSVAKSYANKAKGSPTVYEVQVSLSNPLIVDAKGAVWSQIDGDLNTDKIAQYALDNGYDGVIIQNVIDLGPNPIDKTERAEAMKPNTDVIVFNQNGTQILNSTSADEDLISKSDEQKKEKTMRESRYANKNKEGRPAKEYWRDSYQYITKGQESNLKYLEGFRVHKRVADFVKNTSINFTALPEILQKQIKANRINLNTIYEYVATANNINDYTFKSIAKYIFDNPELAKLNYNEMIKIQDNIPDYAILGTNQIAELADLNVNKVYSFDELQKLQKSIIAETNKNNELAKAYAEAEKYATTYYDIVSGKRTDAISDPTQLNLPFFEHYDGTLKSLKHINDLGKKIVYHQKELTLEENIETGEAKAAGGSSGTWNWLDKKRTASTSYEANSKGTDETMESISRVDKENVIAAYIENGIKEMYYKKFGRDRILHSETAMDKIESQIEEKIAVLARMSDEKIDAKYLEVLGKISEKSGAKAAENLKHIVGDIDPRTISIEAKTAKKYREEIADAVREITKALFGSSGRVLQSRYNALSENIKQYISPISGQTNEAWNKKRDSLRDAMKSSDTKVAEKARNEYEGLLYDFREARDTVKEMKRGYTQRMESRAIAREKAKILAQRVIDQEGKTLTTEEAKPKTMKDKVDVPYKTSIINQEFYVTTPNQATTLCKQLLNTGWSKTYLTNVKALSNNVDEIVTNAETFYSYNSSNILSADTNELEDTARFFIDAKLYNVSDTDYRKFEAIKMYTLGFIYEGIHNGTILNFNPNLALAIEHSLRTTATLSGTMLSVWQNVAKRLDPYKAMSSADMEIDGVPIDGEMKEKFFNAIQSHDAKFIENVQNELIKYVESQKTSKKPLSRRIVSARAMSMLSSPITWLRNKVSNFALKHLNNLSSAIGNKMFSGSKYTVQGQLKLDSKLSLSFDKSGHVTFGANSQVNTQIQDFINQNFLDNGFYEKFVKRISKYNPTEISERMKNETGKPTKEAIYANIVVKSLYNEYYNKNMFNSKFMNSIYQFLMNRMSDDSYVREASVKYFGKILAERKYDLSKMEVTDNIMNDFATSLGLALRDYMHSENVLTDFEKTLSKKNQLAWFAYKTILPFAGASLNWFKEMINYSPIGLIKGIIDITHLEQRITKAEAAYMRGDSNISPELTQYLIKRKIGSGVIGTIAWGLGMLLSSLGYIDLDDDDYGTPKIRIGNVEVDVSSIFGTSSLLAGAALVQGLKTTGTTRERWLQGLNNTADFLLDDFFLMDIVQLDMYSTGGFSMGVDQLESVALSYIPNIVSWIAGATYSGTVKKDQFWQRAIAKIPFLVNLLEKNVDPYTGETGSYWDAINRVVPYFSVDIASQNEKKTTALGLTKVQLRGSYTINNEEFTVTGKQLTAINKAYGELNAQDLTAFYANEMSVKVKVTDNSYSTLTYNEMTDEQRKNAVQTIMSNNADLAKIIAWTSAGNIYYGSATTIKKLRQYGYNTNIYVGTKGFVKSK